MNRSHEQHATEDTTCNVLVDLAISDKCICTFVIQITLECSESVPMVEDLICAPWGSWWAGSLCRTCAQCCRGPAVWRTGRPCKCQTGLRHGPAGSTGNLPRVCPACCPTEAHSGRSDAAVIKGKGLEWHGKLLLPNNVTTYWSTWQPFLLF